MEFDEKTADNGLYLQCLSGRLDAIRHTLLVDELVSLAKRLCLKECEGCRLDCLTGHSSFCVDNVAILLQRFVEKFVEGLFAKSKDGDYYIDERFGMIIDVMVPMGLDIREALSFPTYVLSQYFKRVDNPRAVATLKKLGLDLPLNADVAHGIDSTGVMPTMLSVLCDKKCLTPVCSLLGWE